MTQIPKLSGEDISQRVSALPGWSIDERGQLTRTFKRDNFLAGLAFVTLIADVAEQAGHHPDLLLTYPSVKVSLTTHDAGGLTDKDFQLAKQIDALA